LLRLEKRPVIVGVDTMLYPSYERGGLGVKLDKEDFVGKSLLAHAPKIQTGKSGSVHFERGRIAEGRRGLVNERGTCR